ncbi:hypothetical protein [Salinibacterium sp. ZJ70]|uniref:hypothetical protein n=1 Tax=Salinibacterium sp. ZJ70 TaxID=2708084 RepID=UPI001423C790|nr:hypothetical protein [Salinibacterium sp. ZJ70]
MSVLVGFAAPIGDAAVATTAVKDPVLAQATSTASPANISPFAAAETISCSYGDTGTGQHKDTLCWFDFAYMNGATKTPFSTEWVETFVTPDNQIVCNGTNCTATVTWASAMGAAYGSRTETRSASGNSVAAGRIAAVTAARNAARAGLFADGNRYYGNVTNFPIEVPLPNSSYVFSAKLDVSAPAGSVAQHVQSHVLPTYAGAYMGNSFYTGTTGFPALYQRTDRAAETAANRTTTITLKQIRMSSEGTPVSGYSVVMADAESTDDGESIRFSHSNASAMRWLPNNSTAFSSATSNNARRQAAVGNNVCNGETSTNYRNQWASLTAPNPVNCTGSTAGNKTGAVMLNVLPPAQPTTDWSVTQTMVGRGIQGVAFGVLIGRVNLTVDVAHRVPDSTGAPISAEFGARASAPGFAPIEATTGTTSLSGSVNPSFPIPASGTQLNLSGVPNEWDSSYTQTWQCIKTGGPTTVYWPGPQSSQTSPTPPATNTAWFVLRPGEYIDCTVTYTPPYITLVKDVQQAGTGATNVAADFTLAVAGAGDFAATTSKTSAAGVAPGATGVKLPIAANSANPADVYSFSETGPHNNPWLYGYDWTDITCVANSGSTAFPNTAFTKTINTEGQVSSTGLKVAKGNDLRCTFRNTANEPRLVVKKDAFTAPDAAASNLLGWGTAVAGQSDVYYRITFDNAQGSAPMTVDHTDYLADVLDDATFVAGSFRYGTGAEAGYSAASTSPNGITVTDRHTAADPTVAFEGTLPARSTRTVWFRVTTLANDVRSTDRAEGYERESGVTDVPNRVGFALNNYLVPTGAPLPAVCADPSTGAPVIDSSCTHHPIAAWSVSKGSQPEDGAMIHSGGNIYYRVKIQNFSGSTMTGVQLVDDMTETLAATLWDPTAPPAVTVPYGISFYTANDSHIAGGDIVWNAATGPKPVFGLKPGASGDPAAFDADFTDGTPFPNGQWTFTTPSFTIPAAINGQKVAYAIVGYAVEGGKVASPANPELQYLANGTAPVSALSSATWVNTATAGAATIGGRAVQPTTCSAPQLAALVEMPDECTTFHALGESYFHIWKKSSNEGVGGSGQNLVGSTFVLADTQADAVAGIASRWLCRAGYAVPNPQDPMSEPLHAVGTLTGVDSGAKVLDIGKDSATYRSIEEANRVRAAYNFANNLHSTSPGFRPELSQCGLFFELQGPELDDGQAPGSWRAKDIRGGDLAANGLAPLAKWRTESALNDPSDPSQGRHGTYWIAEMVAPDKHQLLAAPFKIWVAPDASATTGGLFPGHPNWYEYQGRLSLPYVGEGEPEPTLPGGTPQLGGLAAATADGLKLRAMCADAWALPANNQPACVMPTGWSMPIFDVKMRELPLAGGTGTLPLGLAGGAVLLLAVIGAWWWRRRTAAAPHDHERA